MSDLLGVTDEAAVRLLTFRRPDVRNAFNEELYRATAAALDAAAADPSVHVVVLTGEGTVFSAGTDLNEMAEIARKHAAGEDVGESGKGFPLLMDSVVAFPKPLLAAVNGSGVGLGLTLLAHCDLVVIAEGAKLRAPFTTMGVAPEAASSYLLPLRLGAQRANLVLLAGHPLTAEEAVEHGLALKACPAEEVLAETMALARELAEKPLSSLVATKRVITEPHRAAVTAARAREDAAFAELLSGGLGG
ncbi:enoyl-CoA hydratase/isomerase family protein [Actinocorallia sp. A-T 12471]|uniref:enoyl-CoA hydratase/isomerase family protein n=1 Tax=Actinocorallia sp. A-T 12471 TaxID=3089813 RepID=UPI0029CD113D|nr:enoyl-CoA hydratase/isomerase family protein [Actinocorallia sp. A-T 12471]MDX6740965.1 enoyl-CoA hydratase/isomerase family protein [Actinocorallia sp. A-T 12471]